MRPTESIRFISLFAGIGGFDLAFERSGMECVAQVEIDKNARALLDRHFPTVQRFDDVRQVGAHNLPSDVDIVCGGFPCQDLSVAGKRAGLAGERSGLFYEMARIVNELRPSFLIWENVPGLLSSNRGLDFLAVLTELERIGYCGAWTGLDARWFGLAQRRRRIFGVFARGDIGAGCCAEILSLADRLRGDSAPSRGKGEELALDVAAGIRSGGENSGAGVGNEASLYASAWTSRSGGGADDNKAQANHIVSQKRGAVGLGAWDGGDVADTLTSNYASNGGRSGGNDTAPVRNVVIAEVTPVVGSLTRNLDRYSSNGEVDADHIVVDRQLAAPRGARQAKGAFTDPVNDNIIAFAQNTRNEVRMQGGDGRLSGAIAAQPGMKQQTFIAFSSKDSGADAAENIAPTLRAQNFDKSHINGGGQVAIALVDSVDCIKGAAIGRKPEAGPQYGEVIENQSYTLNTTEVHAVRALHHVRRLTPTECERLQGFPDGWTDGQSDSVRYRQLGNAVAVPVVEWISRKLVTFLRKGDSC